MSFSISSSNPRRYVIAVLALLALLLGLTVLARQVLIGTGDFMPEDEIVRFQHHAGKPCMFSEFGKQNEAFYKFEIYRSIKPDIIALGSSRVLEMNQRQFSKPFVNLGRVLTDIKRGQSAVEQLLAIHKPKFMLIGLDQYWFNPNWDEAGVAKVKLTPSDPNDPRAILRLISLLVNQSMWHDGWKALWNGPECHLGLSAKRYLAGYAADGYRYYGELLTAEKQSEDVNFGMTLGRIRNANRRFEKSQVISPQQFAFLLTMHERLQQAGVNHVFYFPTFAPTVTAAMEKDGGFGYIADLETAIRKAGLPFVATPDPDLADCDFIDGFHAGDAAQARQLKIIAAGDSRLAPFLQQDEIGRMSKPGMLPTQYLKDDLGLKPKDYLELGCGWAE